MVPTYRAETPFPTRGSCPCSCHCGLFGMSSYSLASGAAWSVCVRYTDRPSPGGRPARPLAWRSFATSTKRVSAARASDTFTVVGRKTPALSEWARCPGATTFFLCPGGTALARRCGGWPIGCQYRGRSRMPEVWRCLVPMRGLQPRHPGHERVVVRDCAPTHQCRNDSDPDGLGELHHKSDALVLMMPPPATMIGCSASLRMSSAFSTHSLGGGRLCRPEAVYTYRGRTRSQSSAHRRAGRSGQGRAARSA